MEEYLEKLKNIAGKVKEAAESSGVLEVYEQGLERTKQYGTMAKLSFEMNGEREELKRVFQEIGRLCYEDNKDKPEGLYVPLFAQVEKLSRSIEQKKCEMEDIKENVLTPQKDIEVEIDDFDKIVSETEKDGAGQG